MFIAGAETAEPEAKHIQSVVLDGVNVELGRWSRWPGGWHDRRPMSGGEFIGLSEGPTSGFHIEHSADVSLRGCRVRWGLPETERPEYWKHALLARRLEGLDAAELRGMAAFPDRDEAVQID